MLSPWVWAVGGGQYRPYLVTCYLPKPTFGKKYARENKLRPLKPQDVPTSVSLVMNKCNLATNNVEIVYNVPKEKKDFGVCFKMLDFPVTHVSSRIVEMVELLKVLGVGGVHFPYLEDAVDKETMKVIILYLKLIVIYRLRFELVKLRTGFEILRVKWFCHIESSFPTGPSNQSTTLATFVFEGI